MTERSWTRREFVQAGAAIGAAAATAPAFGARLGGWRDEIRVGVVGCGGRGTGAAWNSLEADPDTRLVALADLFEDRLEGSRSRMASEEARERFGDRSVVSRERCHVGFDAYRAVCEADDVDLVILATPPHFRPMQLEAAVAKGKHVFMEKPVAVDPAGVRRVIAAGATADENALCIVAGTQRRHEASYLEAMQKLAAGAIGEPVAARVSWNQGGLWVHERRPEYTDMEWQIRNWLYFTWVSGDHVTEQHIHNLDVGNWVMGGPPLRCMGTGGRQVRTDPKYGNIFDHFAIEYEYEGGRFVQSMCRQIDGCESRVEEVVHGSEGTMILRPNHAVIMGPDGTEWKAERNPRSPYVQEHIDLIEAIRSGRRINEARRVAESTLTAIMGRMSAYTGKAVTWEQAMKSKLDLTPPAYEFGPLPAPEVAVPGRTPLL